MLYVGPGNYSRTPMMATEILFMINVAPNFLYHVQCHKSPEPEVRLSN
jgi:hypothetical protein